MSFESKEEDIRDGPFSSPKCILTFDVPETFLKENCRKKLRGLLLGVMLIVVILMHVFPLFKSSSPHFICSKSSLELESIIFSPKVRLNEVVFPRRP